MALDKNFAKLVAVGIVGGVAKTLFSEPTPVVHNHYDTPDKGETLKKDDA